jgi:hypothetical protein
MDQGTKDQIIDRAAKQIKEQPDSLAVLVRVLSHVFSEGYRYGLSQGHHDRDFPEG